MKSDEEIRRFMSDYARQTDLCYGASELGKGVAVSAGTFHPVETHTLMSDLAVDDEELKLPSERIEHALPKRT